MRLNALIIFLTVWSSVSSYGEVAYPKETIPGGGMLEEGYDCVDNHKLITTSADIVKVDQTEVEAIKRHGVICLVYNNTCTLDIMVPTKTSAEWISGFIENHPSCVDVCCEADKTEEEIAKETGGTTTTTTIPEGK